MLIAVVRDESIAESVKHYCERYRIDGANIRLCDDPLNDAPSIINGGEATILLEVGEADQLTLEKLEGLCRHISGKGAFIVVIENPDAVALRQLFRAGVTDVLPKPAMAADIVAALDSARRQAPSRRAGGKIITVMKSAGGVGATTVAVNTAREIHDKTLSRVALVDLDLQFGTDGLALDIQPRLDVTDVIRAGERIDDTLLRSVMTRHTSGIDVLPAAPTITPLDVIDNDFAKTLMAQLRSSYDFAVIELPSAWTHWFGDILDATDLLLPVTETSVRSADGSSRIMQGLADLSLRDSNMLVIANRFVKKPEAKDRLKKLADIYGVRPEGLIRADEKAATDASDLGKCVKDVAPGSPITEDFSALAEKILSRLGVKVEHSAESRSPTSLRRLLPGVMNKLGERR